jgi:hypothetical protein
MKKIYNYLNLILSICLCSTTMAASNEVDLMRSTLQKQLKLLVSLKPDMERADLARLSVLETQTRVVLTSINEVGLGHVSTFRSFQNYIIAFRYSETYLAMIKNKDNLEFVGEIIKISESIAQKYGFDDSPYTRITENVYMQIYRIFTQQIKQLPISDELRVGIDASIRPIGELLSIAKQGDRPKTFKKAREVYGLIQNLYRLFDKVSASQQAFLVVLEVQGLNEFYAEFAQDFDGVEK